MPTTTVPAAAAGSASTVAMAPVPLLLVTQFSSSSVGSAVNEDGKEEVFVGLVEDITLVSNKRPSKESQATKEVVNLWKKTIKQTQKSLEQLESTLSASPPDLKK